MSSNITKAMMKSDAVAKYMDKRDDIAVLLDVIAVEMEEYDENVIDAWKARHGRGVGYGYAGTAAKIRRDLIEVLMSIIMRRFGDSEAVAKQFVEGHLADMKEGR